MKSSFAILSATLLVASNAAVAQQSSSERQQFLHTWSEAKHVFESAKARNDETPACNAEMNQLYNSMLRIGQDVQHAIETAKASNMPDPRNNSLVNDFYRTGINVLPQLANLTRTYCGV